MILFSGYHLNAKQIFKGKRISQFCNSDSNKVVFRDTESGFSISFPEYWPYVDAREIEPKDKKFYGILFNTPAINGKFKAIVFVLFDKDGEDYKEDFFTCRFYTIDTSIRAYKSVAETHGQMKKVQYYFFTEVEKISIYVSINKEYFNELTPTIESVLSTIQVVPSTK